MTDGHPHPAIDTLLDEFVAAWHAGDAPSSETFVVRAAAADRDELEALIAAFLELAPTVGPSAERTGELAADPLVARLTALEDDWWDARAGASAARVVGDTAAEGRDASEAAPAARTADGAAPEPWGATLRALRERAGLSLAALGAAFAERFGLDAADTDHAPRVFDALERGSRPASRVAARAARALEQLLDAPRGALVAGVAPALADPLLRGALPEAGTERERFTDLLREVDDALAVGETAPPAGETLRGLLGDDAAQ